jgi:ribonuclease T1
MFRRPTAIAALVALALSTGGGPVATGASPPAPAAPGTDVQRGKRAAAIPAEAWDVLAEVRTRRGAPPPGYVGGRTFQNREGRLPRGTYREYDVHPKVAGRPRDAARLVIDQKSGKAYYTGDHYRTFQPMLR